MKTIVKIDPQREYDSAKDVLKIFAVSGNFSSEVSSLDSSIDNLKTVINVLMERLTPQKKSAPKNLKKKRVRKKERKEFDKLPSEKFPNLEVKEEIIEAKEAKNCQCCSNEMTASGLYKISEKLEVIPKQYFIVRKKRVVYICKKCNGSMANAPAEPSISPNSNYGDSVIIDAALTKYCDLIPMERYSAIAAREGVEGLPPNSLITVTHRLAEFLSSIYQGIKSEVLNSKIILADETTHNMLEGDQTKNWFLWGFSCQSACFFEAHDTRSGKIPLDFLYQSKAEYLVTDGYSGYKRAIRELMTKYQVKISEVHCNAHAVRYFKEAAEKWKEECEAILENYGKIYELESNIIDVDIEEKTETRKLMAPLFENIKNECNKFLPTVMSKSLFEKAANYFLNHFVGLTKCLENAEIPLDNNFSERLLRNAVIGRKTWLGTHSKQGAKTSAILFSIVATCKINDINPRKYFHWITEQIHINRPLYTPSEYAKILDSG